MEILGTTKNKITRDEHGRNVPHLDFTEVVLILLIMIINRIQKGYIYFSLVNHLVNYWIFYPKFYIFKNF